MRDPERIGPMLEAVRALWEKYPDWRLGQLISNASHGATGRSDPFYVEDDVLLYGVNEYLKDPLE